MLDVAIIGGGPAGLAAARELGRRGFKVRLFDEQSEPGGSIYHRVATSPVRARLGADYASGLEHVAGLLEDPSIHCAATVWAATRTSDGSFELAVTQDGTSKLFAARRLIVASGALERPMPFPGWTLPGVMGAGAAQRLLKSGGVVADGAVFAGSGPLLLLVVTQYLKLGMRPRALISTTPWRNSLAALPHAVGALAEWRMLAKGLELLAEIRRSGIPVFHDADDLTATGEDHLVAVRFRSGGRAHAIEAKHLFVHHGVVPDTALAASLGCELSWDLRQRCWRPTLDADGQSSVPGVWIAGDAAGIAGADAAALRGTLAGIAVAASLTGDATVNTQHLTNTLRRALARKLRIRPFLDVLYRPRQRSGEFRDDLIICRCETVMAGAIRQLAREGVSDANAVKSRLRCGMGPCQGRMCHLNLIEILADESGKAPDAVRPLRIRPPLKPVHLAELAALTTDAS